MPSGQPSWLDIAPLLLLRLMVIMASLLAGMFIGIMIYLALAPLWVAIVIGLAVAVVSGVLLFHSVFSEGSPILHSVFLLLAIIVVTSVLLPRLVKNSTKAHRIASHRKVG